MANYKQKTFEYRIEYFVGTISLMDCLNIFGKEGWEFVTLIEGGYGVLLKKSNDNYIKDL